MTEQATTISSGASDDRGGAGEPRYRPWLHRFALLTVAATFLLIALGGTVTSKGVGLAVPDWPTTFEQNMFLFPADQWVGGVFWEHTHRLKGAAVGMLCIVLAVWMAVALRGRGPVRWLGVVALGLCIVQGVMGGLRVTELSTSLAVLHGVHAQLFFCVVVAAAAMTSRYWVEHEASGERMALRGRTWWLAGLVVVLVMQLVLGALTRHNEAGLAIEDFPTAFGGVAPPMTEAGVIAARNRIGGDDLTRWQGSHTVGQVWLHYSHRLGAMVVLIVAGLAVTAVAPWLAGRPLLWAPAMAIAVMLGVQVALGASVVWSGRHPEVATAHQVTGAALLATAWLLMLRAARLGMGDVALASVKGRAGDSTTLAPHAGAGPWLDPKGARV